LKLENQEIRERYWQYRTEIFDKFQSAAPSSAHKLISHLLENGKLHCVITQNIDGLHERDIHDKDKIINICGTEMEVICDNCQVVADRQEIHQAIKNNVYQAPLCQHCGQPLKSSVLAFDEPFNNNFIQKTVNIIRQSDLLLIMGSGLMISPSCQLLDIVEEASTQVILMNSKKSVFDSGVTLAVNGEIKTTSTLLLNLLQGGANPVMDRTTDVQMGARSPSHIPT